MQLQQQTAADQYYAYVYYDPSRNNEPIYVGKGKGKRSHSHLKRTGMHPFVQRLQYMAKNNIEPIIQVIQCESEELAFLVEEELIHLHGRKSLGNGPLLNMTNGGEGSSGMIHSINTKRVLSEKASLYKHSDESKTKISNALLNVKKSDLAKENMSKAQLGKTVSNETRQKQEIARQKYLLKKDAEKLFLQQLANLKKLNKDKPII